MEIKTKKLTVRCSPSETQALKDVAKQHRMNVSEFVRSFAQPPKNKDAA